MSLIRVDAEKCIEDGLCAAECPLGIIRLEQFQEKRLPTCRAAAACIECGHCVAVCPTGALSLTTMASGDCPPLRPEWIPDLDRTEHFLRARRSIRKYRSRSVSAETLTRLIEIARFAPSGHNVQPVNWMVVYESTMVEHLTGLVVEWMRSMIRENPAAAAAMRLDRLVDKWDKGDDIICRQAPHVIVTHAPREERTAPAACTIALAYLELAALSNGLGTCWAGWVQTAAVLWPPLQAALNMPEGHRSYGAMMIGYPDITYYRLPLRKAPPITWR